MNIFERMRIKTSTSVNIRQNVNTRYSRIWAERNHAHVYDVTYNWWDRGHEMTSNHSWEMWLMDREDRKRQERDDECERRWACTQEKIDRREASYHIRVCMQRVEKCMWCV